MRFLTIGKFNSKSVDIYVNFCIIEIDNSFSKGYYILKALIDKNKKDLISKTKKYKSYPLYVKFLRELYKYNAFFQN